MAKPAAISESIRSGTRSAKIRVSKSSAKSLTNEMSEIPGPHLSRYSMNSTIAALPHLLEIMNGAHGISDIEGKVTRVGASERGQRTSFKEAEGISDIEGKPRWVAASELGNE